MMKFDPPLLKISPRDTVQFTAPDQGNNVQSSMVRGPRRSFRVGGKSGDARASRRFGKFS
jgi:hypothetical protein